MGQVFGTFYFMYGIVFVLVCMITTSVEICGYLVTHRRLHLAVAAFFLFDMFESSLVFLDEYLGIRVQDSSFLDFPMTHPMLKLALSCGLLASVWAIALGMVGRARPKAFALAFGPFVAVESLTLLIPSNNVKQLVFYTVRSASMLAAAGMVLLVGMRTGDKGLASYIKSLRHLLVAVLVLMIAVMVEDFIGLYDPCIEYMNESGGLLSSLSYSYFVCGRNISENVMTIILSVFAIKNVTELLGMRFEEPPVADSPTARQHVEMRFDRFCGQKGISVREADVVRLVLEGKSNRQIAEELFISPGTVKAHVHAIYRKCGVNNRTNLLQLFWSD